MQIKLKRRGMFGVKRNTFEGKVEKVENKRGLVDPTRESLAVYVRGVDGLGVINFSPKEREMLIKTKAKTLKKKNA